MKTYEYIWLDGYKPESNMRSKVKATEDETPPEWSTLNIYDHIKSCLTIG